MQDAAESALDSAEFFTRGRQRLNMDMPRGLNDPSFVPAHGDHQADPVLQKISEVRPIRPAAVLVPVIDHDEPTILLTQRAIHLPNHAGQISFPGGKIETSDASPRDAALRETMEEIGLGADFIEPVGYLDLYMTTLGFRIVPLLARVKPGFQLALNESEVDHAFEVPLSFLMTEGNYQRNSRDWNGLTRHYYAVTFGERYIWGVTAGILRNLHQRLWQP